MKNNLTITSAVAAALILAACNPQTPVYPEESYAQVDYDDDDDDFDIDRKKATKVCTDKSGTRVADSKCTSSSGGVYTAMFLRSGQRVPAYGTKVVGGSYSRPAYTSSYSSSRPSTSSYSTSSVSRGGFGSSASSFSSGSGS